MTDIDTKRAAARDARDAYYTARAALDAAAARAARAALDAAAARAALYAANQTYAAALAAQEKEQDA